MFISSLRYPVVLGYMLFTFTAFTQTATSIKKLVSPLSVSNADISPGVEFYTSLDTYICSLALPHLTVARRLLEIVTKVTNLETVKIEFRHLRFLLSFFLLSFFHSPSAFTRAVPRPKHPRTVVKFSWHVPFELCF